MTWRAQFYWQGRREDEGRHAERAMEFVRSLCERVSLQGAWTWLHPGTGERRALELPGDFQNAVRASAVRWRSGARAHTSHVLELRCDERGEARVECRLTLGVHLPDLPGLFAPEQARVVVHRGVGGRDAVIAALDAVFTSAVKVFDPTWGHAGSVRFPLVPTAIFDGGAPRPGWWTYLRRGLPVPTLAPPATTHDFGDRGVIVRAHPDLFDERDASHLYAIERVRAAMKTVEARALSGRGQTSFG